jgi:methyl halide transferase
MDSDQPAFWESNYATGSLPWDLGRPAPIFQRLIESGRYPAGRMIVLGAGTGHDARLFARHGFQVTAVDFAQGAIRAMEMLQDPGDPIIIQHADLFVLPARMAGLFDYVLEYTCFCAISPSRRETYADVVRNLLRPGGVFLALLWPVGAQPGGPPYTVEPDEVIGLFATRGFSILHRESPADSIPERLGQEELLVMQCK